MQKPPVHRRSRPRSPGSPGGRPRPSGTRFAANRAAALDRLVHGGIPRTMAQAWIEAWDESTAELHDFREAPDFWVQGYRFAREEYARGYRPLGAADPLNDERDPGLQ